MDARHFLNVPGAKPRESIEQLLQESMVTAIARSTTGNAIADDAGHALDTAPFFEGRRTAARPSPGWLAVAVAWLKDMPIFKALLILYCLNVVAWGVMIFLLLCNAAPAMCSPSCNHVNSPRHKWIEIDSQILNALFCVPAFSLAPQRFSDAWRVLQAALGALNIDCRVAVMM